MIGAAIGGIASALGSFLGQNKANVSNERIAKENREFQAGEAMLARNFGAGETAKNRDFQERMSSTAYQRSMEDMKTAGLNPALAFMKGGASTPPGGSATSPSPSGSTAKMENTMRDLNLANTALIVAQTKKLNSETGLTDAKANVINPASTFGSGSEKGIKILTEAFSDGVESISDFIKWGGENAARSSAEMTTIWKKAFGSSSTRKPLKIDIKYD